jgi:drug/metabolite transporter (DMT)-like permease
MLPVGLGRAPLADIVLQAVYQGGLTTVLGLFAFNRAVALLGPAAGAALPALVPVVTPVLAALLLGETPGPRDIAAAGLVGAGVALVTSARTARPGKDPR